MTLLIILAFLTAMYLLIRKWEKQRMKDYEKKMEQYPKASWKPSKKVSKMLELDESEKFYHN